MRNRIRRGLSLLLVPALVGPMSAANADSFRCGSRLVYDGQATAEVYERCGEPTARAAETQFVTVHLQGGVDVTRPVYVERWLYDRGPKRFVRFLTFVDDTLVTIDEGSYGYR